MSNVGAMSTSGTIVIESFGQHHIAQARALWQRSEGVGLSDADEPQALAAYLSRNPSLSLVALLDEEVVGTVLCGHDGRRGFLHHLVVAPGQQRRGIGRQLLGRGLAALRGAGIQKCHLLVFKSNSAGQAFWRAVGAEERSSLALFSLSTKNGA